MTSFLWYSITKLPNMPLHKVAGRCPFLCHKLLSVNIAHKGKSVVLFGFFFFTSFYLYDVCVFGEGGYFCAACQLKRKF